MIIRFILHHLQLLDAAMLLLPVLVMLTGWWISRRRRRLGLVTILIGLICGLGWAYGRYVGSQQLVVRQQVFCSPDLPAAFDGYRIVQFSDAHVGSMTEGYLRRAIDSINAQHADLIVFTGDLQNVSVNEVYERQDLLSQLKAPDGVMAVLGNHDYAMYMDQNDPFAIAEQLGHTDAVFSDMGWHLLRNGHYKLERDSARIIIAGMENDGEGRFPHLGNHNQALFGISRDEFIIMLEHDPTSWRRRILPHTHCQLTLSGHTHGGQLTLLGWSPARLIYHEYGGMYYAGDRALNVSRGLGGAIPFRLWCPGEINVITLKRIED